MASCHLLQRLAHLSQDGKPGLVRGQRQHDEVSVQPVHAVPRVGVVAGGGALLANVGHDLVLALARGVGIGEDDLEGKRGRKGGGLTSVKLGRAWWEGPERPLVSCNCAAGLEHAATAANSLLAAALQATFPVCWPQPARPAQR